MTSIAHFPRPQAEVKVDIRQLSAPSPDDPQKYVLDITFNYATFDSDWRMNLDQLECKWFVSKEQLETVLFQLQSAMSATFDPQAQDESVSA